MERTTHNSTYFTHCILPLWGRTGGVWTPYPRGSTPIPPSKFFLPNPTPFFPLFFFSGTPAQNSDFCPRPAPIWPSPPAHFSLKATLPPTPYLLGPQPPMSSPTPLSLIQFWSCSAAFVSFSGHCNSFAQISGCIPGGCIAQQVDQSMCATLVVISLKGEFCIFFVTAWWLLQCWWLVAGDGNMRWHGNWPSHNMWTKSMWLREMLALTLVAKYRTQVWPLWLLFATKWGMSPSKDCCGPFYQHCWTLIPAWISIYIHCKVWDEIAYPFLNFNGATIEV